MKRIGIPASRVRSGPLTEHEKWQRERVRRWAKEFLEKNFPGQPAPRHRQYADYKSAAANDDTLKD